MRGQQMPDILSGKQKEQVDTIFPNIDGRLFEMLSLQRNSGDVQFDYVFRLEELKFSLSLLNEQYSLNLNTGSIPHLNKGPTFLKELAEKEKKALLEVYSEDFEIYHNARTFS